MPLRKKIFRILRRISTGTRLSKDTPTDQSAVREAPVSPESTSPPPDDSEVTKHKSEENTGLILYGRPSCPYCARVDRVIEELGIEEKITRRLTTIGSEWRTDLRNRTGSTQVPCLFIDGNPMFESLDIIDWMRTNLA